MIVTTIDSASIFKHTTSSTPQPHVVYIIEVTHDNGVVYEIHRRYSEFLILKSLLGDSFPLPPRRMLTTSVVPSAWVGDALIDERKKGLQMYLTYLLHDLGRRRHPALARFLGFPGGREPRRVVALDMVQANHRIPSSARIRDEEEDKKKFIAASYYPSWASDTCPPTSIDFSKFDVLFFAFVTPNNSSGIDWDDGSKEVLKELISSAHKSGFGTRIVLSVGGWSGCRWFSQAMSSATNRKKLMTTLVATVNQYGLDGIDIDWEYPNASGAGNPHSSADAANLLSFFKSLRIALGPSKIISAAVTQQPWLGEDGDSLKDVADFAAQLTYINIMNYDVFDASSKPGPNAPLGDLCGTSKQPDATAHAALDQWTKAGMPASKLLLGLPLYGYASKSSAKKLSGSLLPYSNDPVLTPHPRAPPTDSGKRAPMGDLSSWWGQQVAFSQIVSIGALKKNADGTYDGANGYTMGWDNCSDTPYLFNTDRTTVVTYDDTYSIASKTQFVKKSGMAGCFTWSLDQDDGLALHNVMLHNLGK